MTKKKEVCLIEHKIYVIRGQKVMLDRDLAELYGVGTTQFNQQVKRNLKRFPMDFMFLLTQQEFANLKSQFVTSSWGGTRKLPRAFTEQGVAMLSGILNSDRAIEVNIAIMRTFVKMRQMLADNALLREKIDEMEKKYDTQFTQVFMSLRQLFAEFDAMRKENKSRPSKHSIGFHIK